MTATPCGIPDCPAIAEHGSRWCSVHIRMTPEERGRELDASEQRQFRLKKLVPVTDRIEYEKKR